MPFIASVLLVCLSGGAAFAQGFHHLEADERSIVIDAVRPGTSGAGSREVAAYQLLALGYSARETADIVSGRISRHALDAARQMLAAGQPREIAANYLEGEYKRVRALRSPGVEPRDRRHPQLGPALSERIESNGPTLSDRRRGSIDEAVQRYASLYNVNAELVRAMIAVESAFDASARSRAGAIGLMQLMPGTARELGVNPLIPEQNVAGGVRYLSELLKTFGDTELALVAYNAGPGFARRYLRRETALYGETREYVRRVLARL